MLVNSYIFFVIIRSLIAVRPQLHLTGTRLVPVLLKADTFPLSFPGSQRIEAIMR